MNHTSILYRASILHFESASEQPQSNASYFSDGALIVSDDKIIDVGDYQNLIQKYQSCEEVDYSDRLIIPGLIDSHLHYPQTEMLGKYGSQLLDWLESYTFPTERKFHDPAYCAFIAQQFVYQLIDNGTTTAFAYSSVHKQSVNALFECASKINMAIITGKVCMDRHCPDDLKDTPEIAQKESEALIENWHEKGRNLYALTPRFAPTSTDTQLGALGELVQQYPNVFLQTHLSENTGEISWVTQLFPNHESYLDVYDHYHMVHSRSLFGHCIHLSDPEWERLADAQSTVVFCPTSNLFLGSGLFSLSKAKAFGVQVALATDTGGGTTFNMLKTYGEAYKIGQLQGVSLDLLEGLYMMTQGPACYYGLDHEIGNLNPGSYADFVVINPHFNALSTLRSETLQKETDAHDLLFALSFIGDDRAIEATYIAGVNQKQHHRRMNDALA